MNEKDSKKNIIKKIKGIKNIELLVAVLIIAIIISLYASTLYKPSSVQDDQLKGESGVRWVEKEYNMEDRQEIRLQRVLSVIKGAGKVEVMITYQSGKEIVPAVNNIETIITTEEEDNNGGTRKVNQTDTNTQPVTFNNSEGSKPLILKEVEPEIKGVIVIAEGAGDVRVKMELLRAVQVALGIKPNQVEVFSMEK